MTKNDDQPDFYTVNELAVRWKVTPRFVREEIARGKLKKTSFGRAVRIPAWEVEAYEAKASVHNRSASFIIKISKKS